MKVFNDFRLSTAYSSHFFGSVDVYTEIFGLAAQDFGFVALVSFVPTVSFVALQHG